MSLTGADWETMLALATPVLTAFLTAYVTAKANERVLHNIMDRVDDVEQRLFDHEKRISRLEGSVKT